MAQTPQSYQNHTRWFPPYHFFVMPVLLINFLNSIRHVYMERTLHMTWEMIVAAALVMLGLLARVMVVAVQDRVIRLEMRLRLHELLPADLRARIKELTREQ